MSKRDRNKERRPNKVQPPGKTISDINTCTKLDTPLRLSLVEWRELQSFANRAQTEAIAEWLRMKGKIMSKGEYVEYSTQ